MTTLPISPFSGRHLRLLGIEASAVVLNLLYTILYIQGNDHCFYFALTGSALFVYLCYVKRIFAESFLQLFYVAFAIYGLAQISPNWTAASWSLQEHITAIVIATASMLIIGFVLKKKSNAALPYLDAFTTTFSILATWIMVNFVHENWLYWMVIDSVSIYLYLKRKLYIGALLFVVYLTLAIAGYFHLSWP